MFQEEGIRKKKDRKTIEKTLLTAVGDMLEEYLLNCFNDV